MDHVALSLRDASWTYLGGDDEAKKELEVVLRAFDQDVEFATGKGANQPDDESVTVPRGEGRRLTGRHFFARPTAPGAACRVTQRGL